MNTLTIPPVSNLLARLFRRGRRHRRRRPARAPAARPPDERAAIMRRAQTDYRAFYGDARAMSLPGPARDWQDALPARPGDEGAIHRRVRDVVRPLDTPPRGRRARQRRRPDHRQRLRAVEGRAGARAPRRGRARRSRRDREATRSWKRCRAISPSRSISCSSTREAPLPKILALLEPRLAVGALVVADNADDSPDYVAHVRRAANGYVLVPFTGDVELSARLG